MKLACPVCQMKFTLAQVAHEATMIEVAELSAKFGIHWELVSEYLDCFRREQWGSVGLKKMVRLLKEILALFEKNEFEYQGKSYRTDRAKILTAMKTTVNSERFGFTNHNYLKKVLIGEKAERLSAEGLTAKEETHRETMRKSGARSQEPEEEKITAGEFIKRHGLKNLKGEKEA